MDSQKTPLDLTTLAHALPALPSPAEQDKVVASFSFLPPELKLKIVEEIYQDPRAPEEAESACPFAGWALSRYRKTRMKELESGGQAVLRVERDLQDINLTNSSLPSLRFFLVEICRKHGARIRTLCINRNEAQAALLIVPVSMPSLADQTLPLFRRRKMTWAERNLVFDQAEELEKRMKGLTTRYAAGHCKNRDEFRWDIEGVYLSLILRTCPGLYELNVRGLGLLQHALLPPRLQSLRSLTLHLGPGQAHPNLAFLRQSSHLQQLSLVWRTPEQDPPRIVLNEILECLNQQQQLKSLSLLHFPPAFFEGPPRLELSLEDFEVRGPADWGFLKPFLRLFSQTLLHLRLYASVNYAEPPPTDPLLPHLISLSPPGLWQPLGFSGPVGGGKKA